MKLEGLTVENVYSILDKVPPGKVYMKVIQSNSSEKIPLQLNDALSKLQSERQLLDEKMSGKSKSVGTASTLSGASGSSDFCGRFSFQGSSREQHFFCFCVQGQDIIIANAYVHVIVRRYSMHNIKEPIHSQC